MPFCTNCGAELSQGVKFCNSCGAAVLDRDNKAGKTEFEDILYNCPCCGQPLQSFVSNCPYCGYEIRGTAATHSVSKFYEELIGITDNAKKQSMIRNFPVPNTKEDIIEFMILAAANITDDDEKGISDAWTAKLEQCYHKASIMFNKTEIRDIQKIYDDCQEKLTIEKNKRIKKYTFDTIVRNLIVAAGLILLLLAVVVDRNHENATLLELVACIMLIASAASLIKRNAVPLDYAVSAIGGLVTIGVSFLFGNGSLVQLSGGIVLIIAAVNYFKSIMIKNKK